MGTWSSTVGQFFRFEDPCGRLSRNEKSKMRVAIKHDEFATFLKQSGCTCDFTCDILVA